jgi:hypothetical protein
MAKAIDKSEPRQEFQYLREQNDRDMGLRIHPPRISTFEMAKTIPFCLSPQGLRLANQISRKDFRFVSGSNAILCDRFEAGFLSPRVTILILNHPTIEEFSLQDSDSDSKSQAKIEMIERLMN